MISIRIVLSVAVSLDLEIEQMDVKRTFLYGDIKIEIYMEHPEGFKVKGKENYVYKLKKSQASSQTTEEQASSSEASSSSSSQPQPQVQPSLDDCLSLLRGERDEQRPGSPIIEDCYEYLFLVSTANEEGVKTLYKSGGLNVLASQLMILPDGSHMIELAMRLVQIIVIKLPSEIVYSEHPTDLSTVVSAVAKQFAVLQNSLKFEALHLLSAILSNRYSVC
ncbi:hypothetical protein CQW23_24492 [Capsicum baccatum]|uniref:Reverse transcriptase Ty1/copia-type domain-containing protein n=1 Tax=Capsicum baccatum TaxID=33114 RepID=A0A2G2VV13_CAPBA|nr:hypothetical protein CQW23_24492 [Capsicum baccatum]